MSIGLPLGEEPEGWEDLRGVPFELHYVGSGKPPIGALELLFEIRPGGLRLTEFDGSPALPFRLYREGTPREGVVEVSFGSGALSRLLSPHGGWSPRLPLWLSPGTETSISRMSIDIPFVRMVEGRDRWFTIGREGLPGELPLPGGGQLGAGKTELVIVRSLHRGGKWEGVPPSTLSISSGGETMHFAGKRAPLAGAAAEPVATPGPLPFDVPGDLLRARDAAGSPIRPFGTSMGGGLCIDTFRVADAFEAPIRYPVEARFRYPIRWSRRTYRFLLQDFPLPRSR
ncbi:MAG: hypothetical protein HUU06_07945 [Planctomycetaceae bacterium]|nr:hypothetical protein [Planctomycetaceae bacterium]